MIYRFKCPECWFVDEVEIPMAEYDERKNTVLCPVCYALKSNQVLMNRVIEWNGIATGAGEGWFGRSDGSTAI